MFFQLCFLCLHLHKVRCSRHRHHHSATSLRERKPTTTLLITAFVSLLSWLPFPTVYIIISLRHSWNSFYYFHMTVLILFLATSLVNPIIYSLRTPEFKACVVRMFFKAPNRDNAADLPLNSIVNTNSSVVFVCVVNYLKRVKTKNKNIFF